MGSAAADALIAMVESEAPTGPMALDVSLKIRNSLGPVKKDTADRPTG